jgi:hypothetical protein
VARSRPPTYHPNARLDLLGLTIPEAVKLLQTYVLKN